MGFSRVWVIRSNNDDDRIPIAGVDFHLDGISVDSINCGGTNLGQHALDLCERITKNAMRKWRGWQVHCKPEAAAMAMPGNLTVSSNSSKGCLHRSSYGQVTKKARSVFRTKG